MTTLDFLLTMKKANYCMNSQEETMQELFDDLARYIDEVYLDTSIVEADSAISHYSVGSLLQASFDEAGFDENEAPSLASCAPATAPTSLAERLRNIDESFSQTVLRLIDERGMRDAEVYKRANMSRQLFSKLRKDKNYRPKKQTACALALALELDLDAASELLERAGFTLSHSSKFDIIIEYFLLNNVHDIMQVNEALYTYDQSLLG